MAPTDAEESSEPRKQKYSVPRTWVLKVSVHCEGCKRKVKKILDNVEGVHEVDVDVKQQKATVTGIVQSDALIKKLAKSGKHAELWPQKVEQKEKKSGKYNNKEKQSDPVRNEDQTVAADKNKSDNKPVVKAESVKEPAKDGEGGGYQAKNDDAGAALAKVAVGAAKNPGVGLAVKVTKSEGKKPEIVCSGSQPPFPSERKGSENLAAAGSDRSGVGGDGNGGKKKKKKGRDGNEADGQPTSSAPAGTESQPNHAANPPSEINHSPPRHHGYQQYPPHFYYAPPPVYAVSYNTAYATTTSSTYTTSYYAAPPPYSQAYSSGSSYSEGPETEPPPLDSDLSYPRQPLDSFEIFSDENPNGCSIM